MKYKGECQMPSYSEQPHVDVVYSCPCCGSDHGTEFYTQDGVVSGCNICTKILEYWELVSILSGASI